MNAGGLHLIEDFAVESGGLGVTNICLDKDHIPAGRPGPAVQPDQRHRSPGGRSRLRHLRAGTRGDGLWPLPPAQEYNPLPPRDGACDGGWYTRNLPIEKIIGGPAFRDPDGDCLLQAAGLVAQALLWHEEPPDGEGIAEAFGIVDRSLNRRAARNGPQGVVRR